MNETTLIYIEKSTENMGPHVINICEIHCVQNIAYFRSFTYASYAFIYNKGATLV